MPIKWVFFIISLWTICAIICCVLEDSAVGEGEVSTLQSLYSLDVFSTSWYSSLGKIFTWNFNFLTGPWSIFKWVILYPLSAAFALTLAVIILTTLTRGLGTIFGVFR